MNFGPYSVKNVKIARGFGRENAPMNANLFREGRKIGTVTDDGNGGGAWPRINGEEMRALAVYCSEQPQEPTDYGRLTVSLDFFVGALMEEAIRQKDEVRILKRFQKKGFAWAARLELEGQTQYIAARTRADVEGAPPVNAGGQSHIIDIEAVLARAA